MCWSTCGRRVRGGTGEPVFRHWDCVVRQLEPPAVNSWVPDNLNLVPEDVRSDPGAEGREGADVPVCEVPATIAPDSMVDWGSVRCLTVGLEPDKQSGANEDLVLRSDIHDDRTIRSVTQ